MLIICLSRRQKGYVSSTCMAVVVSSSTPRPPHAPRPTCPGCGGPTGAQAQELAQDGCGQLRFPSCRSGSFLKGLFFSSVPPASPDFPWRMAQSQPGAQVGKEQRECWPQCLHVRQGHCSVPLLTRCRCGKTKRQSSVWSLHFYFGEGKCQWFVCKIWACVRQKSWILRSKWQIARAAGAVTVYKVARNNQWNYSLVLHGCLSAIMEIRYHQNCWKNSKITVGTILGYDSSI